MIKIADIKGLKLNITWKLLYRGLLEKQISINEIVEYAKEQLEKGEDRIEICELAGSGDYDLEDVMFTAFHKTSLFLSVTISLLIFPFSVKRI